MITTALTAGLTFGLCAAARRRAESMAPREGKWVRFRPTVNRGAAFGLPLDPALLPMLSTGSLLVILSFRKMDPMAAGLMLGGGLSNLWERVDRGEVLDYLQFPRAPGKLGTYVYNPADLAILAGGLALLLREAGKLRREK